MDRKCYTCDFWDETSYPEAWRTAGCRRNAPLFDEGHGGFPRQQAKWPQVRGSEWCGDWTPNTKRPTHPIARRAWDIAHAPAIMTFDEWLKKRDPMHDIGWPADDQMREAWNAALEAAAAVVEAGDWPYDESGAKYIRALKVAVDT